MASTATASATVEPSSRIVLWDLAPASTGVQGSVEVCPAITTGVRALDFRYVHPPTHPPTHPTTDYPNQPTS